MVCKHFFKVPSHGRAASLGLALVRVVAGLAFVLHGWGKIQSPMDWMGPEAPVPGVLQLLAAIAEFVGGFAWVVGAFFPLASFGIGATMLVAVFVHAVQLGHPFVGKGGAYELPLLYLCVAILFGLAGPGEYSIDRKLFGRRSNP